jgi:hypothetical protein
MAVRSVRGALPNFAARPAGPRKDDRFGGTATEPRRYFYALSALAFVLWSLAVIDTVARAGHLTGSSGDGQRAFILTAAAFFIPMLDSLFSLPSRKASEPMAGHSPDK